jgi:hypothetical protein
MATNPDKYSGIWTDFQKDKAKGIRVGQREADFMTIHTDELGNVPLATATARWPQLAAGLEPFITNKGITKGFWWKDLKLGWCWTSDDNSVISTSIRIDELFALLPKEAALAWVLNCAIIPRDQQTRLLSEAINENYTGEFLHMEIQRRWGKKYAVPKNLKSQDYHDGPFNDKEHEWRPWQQAADIQTDDQGTTEMTPEEIVRTWVYQRQQEAEYEEENHHHIRSSKKAKNQEPWGDRHHPIHRTAAQGGLSPRTLEAYKYEFHRHLPIAPLEESDGDLDLSDPRGAQEAENVNFAGQHGQSPRHRDNMFITGRFPGLAGIARASTDPAPFSLSSRIREAYDFHRK